MLKIQGNIVKEGGIEYGCVEIDENSGKIVNILPKQNQADIFLENELIFPGFTDLHVHARECATHSQDYKEDFMSAGQAAINGGVVGFMDMPNNPIPPIDDLSYKEKLDLVKKAEVEVLLYAGIVKNSRPLKAKVPYKVYMSHSVGGIFFESFLDLEETIKFYKGEEVSFHCEDPKILTDNRQKENHAEQRPISAEISAIDFAIYLIEKYSLKGKICHLSTKLGLEKIIQAKKRGIDLVCEITPHHLYFNESNNLIMNPPLRKMEDCQALIQGLKNGDIDFLATDHAPHTLEDKKNGSAGLPLLDTYGPFVAWLIKEHKFTPQEILRVCSLNPGKFFNKFSNNLYGKIEPGYIGSLTILDLENPITITKEMLKTKCAWSPFEGVEFPGRVKMTIVKGRVYNHY